MAGKLKERIWAFVGGANQKTQLWLDTPPPYPGMCQETEYVRGDLYGALLDELSRLREVERRTEEVLTPFAMTAKQMDREMPGARNQKVTFEHPSKVGADEECDQWPLPDNFMVLHAWRYHDPRPISEAMGFQMVHLRAALELYRALSEREGQE